MKRTENFTKKTEEPKGTKQTEVEPVVYKPLFLQNIPFIESRAATPIKDESVTKSQTGPKS